MQHLTNKKKNYFWGGETEYLYEEKKKETRSTNHRKSASLISVLKALITTPYIN